MIHNLKIKAEYADEKVKGNKPFEIRLDDRRYRVGDFVRYTAVNEKELKIKDHPINDKVYQITYITDFMQRNGYIVFGETEILMDI